MWKIQVYDISKKLWTTKGEELEAGRKEFFETFKILEGELNDKSYFGDEKFGFADLLLSLFTAGSMPLRYLAIST